MPLSTLRGVLGLQQLDDAFDRVGIVVLAENALTFLVSVLEFPKVADKNRHVVALGDDDVAEILQRGDQADAAHHVGLLAAGKPAAASIGAVVVDRRDDIAE